jgi:hypothetical protein
VHRSPPHLSKVLNQVTAQMADELGIAVISTTTTANARRKQRTRRSKEVGDLRR